MTCQAANHCPKSSSHCSPAGLADVSISALRPRMRHCPQTAHAALAQLQEPGVAYQSPHWRWTVCQKLSPHSHCSQTGCSQQSRALSALDALMRMAVSKCAQSAMDTKRMLMLARSSFGRRQQTCYI